MTVPGVIPTAGPPPAPPTPATLVANGQTASSGSGGLSFGDVLDTINPLQHIPFVSSLYRAATGSHISDAAQITGDTLYGSIFPGGAVAAFASSLANVAVKETTGSDISQHVLNTLAPSSSAQTQTPAAVPVAQSPSDTGTPAPGTSPIMRISHDTQAGSAQYQRAQAFDALNKQLVKMAI